MQDRKASLANQRSQEVLLSSCSFARYRPVLWTSLKHLKEIDEGLASHTLPSNLGYHISGSPYFGVSEADRQMRRRTGTASR